MTASSSSPAGGTSASAVAGGSLSSIESAGPSGSPLSDARAPPDAGGFSDDDPAAGGAAADDDDADDAAAAFASASASAAASNASAEGLPDGRFSAEGAACSSSLCPHDLHCHFLNGAGAKSSHEHPLFPHRFVG